MPTFREDIKLGHKVPLVKTDDINDQAVTTRKLRDGAVTSEKIASEAVTKDKFDKELLQVFEAASGLPENLIKTIQDVDTTLADYQRQLNDKQSQLDDKQEQIIANKKSQEEKNASLDTEISNLHATDKQITDSMRDIAVTGGASTANAVVYDNTSSGLEAINAQAALDEIESKKIGKENIVQTTGTSTTQVMSQKAVNRRFAVINRNCSYYTVPDKSKLDIKNFKAYKIGVLSLVQSSLLYIPIGNFKIKNLVNSDSFKGINYIPAISYVDSDFNIVGHVFTQSSDFNSEKEYELDVATIPTSASYMVLNLNMRSVVTGEDYTILDHSEFFGLYDSGINFLEVVKFKQALQTLEEKIDVLSKIVSYSRIFDSKNCVLIGDSITYLGGDMCDNPKGWSYYFNQLLKFKDIKSYAKNAATWTNTADTKYSIGTNYYLTQSDNNAFNQINVVKQAILNGTQPVPDYIIIALGTNDSGSRFNYSAETSDLDSVLSDDTTNYETDIAINTCTSIVKSIRFIHDMIINDTNLGNAQVVILTPLQSANITKGVISKVGDIIEKCAEMYSWNVIRQDKECGVSRLQELRNYTNTYDGTHPSTTGSKNIGNYLAYKLSSILR